MKYHAEAVRVASKMAIGIDSLQLNKHMSAVAIRIAQDILSPKYKRAGISIPQALGQK
jgi:hypothetical protein